MHRHVKKPAKKEKRERDWSLFGKNLVRAEHGVRSMKAKIQYITIVIFKKE